MKTYKDFIKRTKPLPVLSWPSSHAEMREIPDVWNKPLPVVSWQSSHAEVRKKTSLDENDNHNRVDGSDPKPKTSPSSGSEYDSKFHDHLDVIPQKLSLGHTRAIKKYATASSEDSTDGHASSGNMNAYLRNREGNKDQHIIAHTPEKVKKSIEHLSSAFSKENTNRVPLTTHGGVPTHIGEALESSGQGSQHHLAGFTSTSSDLKMARTFADCHTADRRKPRHIIKYHVEPGAGMSLVHHSKYSENEVLLHHGARITYSHTEIQPKSPLYSETHFHHVTVHPDHKPLHEYGPYAEK